MTHESWIAQLDAYLDGELEGGKMQELDRHLRECPSCAAESLRRLQWKRTAHSAGQRYKPDSALRERMQKSLSREGSKRMAWRWQAFGALAAALLVMAGLGIVWRENRQVRENQIVSELADLLNSQIVNVSHHLGVLRHAGLVQDVKHGRFVVYSLHPDVFRPGDDNHPVDHLDLGCCRLEIPRKKD